MALTRAHVRSVFGQLDARFKSGNGCGIQTAIPSLDRTGGLISGDLVVLAGRPGVGKTTLALHIAMHAVSEGTPTLYVSLAETGDQLTERALAATGAVDRTSLRRGRLQRQDMSALTAAAALLSQLPLQFEDATDLTACRVRALIATWRASNHDTALALVIVDCMQLLDGEPDRCCTRDEDIAQAVRTLQSAAKESRVAILLVSQLAGEQLCELGGALEAGAAAVLLAHAPADPHAPFEVTLAKHRRAAVPVTDELGFDPGTGAFRSLTVEPD